MHSARVHDVQGDTMSWAPLLFSCTLALTMQRKAKQLTNLHAVCMQLCPLRH